MVAAGIAGCTAGEDRSSCGNATETDDGNEKENRGDYAEKKGMHAFTVKELPGKCQG